MTLLTKLYRPSQSKIESLRDKLKSLDIRNYPGENVTTFVQDASKLVREIRMNFTSNSNVPDLTTTALSGLTLSSDDFLLAQVRTLRINSDVNGFGGILGSFQAKDPIAALQTINDLYRVLISQSDYGPARQIDIKHKALQAKVEDKLVQETKTGIPLRQMEASLAGTVAIKESSEVMTDVPRGSSILASEIRENPNMVLMMPPTSRSSKPSRTKLFQTADRFKTLPSWTLSLMVKLLQNTVAIVDDSPKEQANTTPLSILELEASSPTLEVPQLHLPRKQNVLELPLP